MKTQIGKMDLPEEFKYLEVLKNGKQCHYGDAFSRCHPKMDYAKRAKIFAPFAALKGFEEEVGSKEVRYEKKREVDADGLYELNEQLNQLYERTFNGHDAKQNPVKASIEYYVLCEDEKSEFYQKKGRYFTVEGIVEKVDPEQKVIRIGGKRIAFSDLYRIEMDDYGKKP